MNAQAPITPADRLTRFFSHEPADKLALRRKLAVAQSVATRRCGDLRGMDTDAREIWSMLLRCAAENAHRGDATQAELAAAHRACVALLEAGRALDALNEAYAAAYAAQEPQPA